MISTRSPNEAGWVNIRCMICEDLYFGSKKGLSCGVNINTGKVKCFRCESFSVFSELKDETYVPELVTKDDIPTIEAPPGFVSLAHDSALKYPRYSEAIKYAVSRKIPKELFHELQVGVGDRFTADVEEFDETTRKLACRLHKKIIIPITIEGKWVGYVGRSYEDAPYMKFCNSVNSWRKHCVWNMDSLYDANLVGKPLLVMEGILDAIPYYPYAVALMGKPSREQTNLLSTVNRPIIVCLDGDATRESEALSLKLKVLGKRSSHIRLAHGEDPNSAATEYIWSLVNQELNLLS